jgi:hypothetical protein
LAIPIPASAEAIADNAARESTDSHLRSTEGIAGYHVEASDGEIGHVDGFIIDDQAWAIRYIEVATRNWWPGKKVLVSPVWAERVSWEESKVSFGLTSSPSRSHGTMKNNFTHTMAGRLIGCGWNGNLLFL